jgi:hypothetical protein
MTPTYTPLEFLEEERLQKTSGVMPVSALCERQVGTGKNVLGPGKRTIPTSASKILASWFALFYHIENLEALEECKKILVVKRLPSALLARQAEDMRKVGIPAVAWQWLDRSDKDICSNMGQG